MYVYIFFWYNFLFALPDAESSFNLFFFRHWQTLKSPTAASPLVLGIGNCFAWHVPYCEVPCVLFWMKQQVPWTAAQSVLY